MHKLKNEVTWNNHAAVYDGLAFDTPSALHEWIRALTGKESRRRLRTWE